MEVNENENYQCEPCQTDKIKRDSNKLIEQKKKLKGCFKAVPKNVYAYRNVSFQKCPANFNNRSITELFTAYFNFKNGLLPFNGSLMEQPYKIIEIFNVIDSYTEHKKQQEVSKNGRRSKN